MSVALGLVVTALASEPLTDSCSHLANVVSEIEKCLAGNATEKSAIQCRNART